MTPFSSSLLNLNGALLKLRMATVHTFSSLLFGGGFYDRDRVRDEVVADVMVEMVVHPKQYVKSHLKSPPTSEPCFL